MSMRFVIDFCTNLVTKFASHASDKTQIKGANDYSVLATSMIFENVARTKGYITYSHLAKLSKEEQQHVYDTMLDERKENVEDVNKTLDELHPRVREVGMRSFVADSHPPNVLSPFHLISQSLIEEHKALTYEMIADTIGIPLSFLKDLDGVKKPELGFFQRNWHGVTETGRRMWSRN